MGCVTHKIFGLAGIILSFGVFDVRAEDNCVFWVKGECFDCYTPQTLEVGTPENCLKHCPNRVVSIDTPYVYCKLNEKGFSPYIFYPIVSEKDCNGPSFEGIFGECKCCETTEAVRISYDCEQDEECRNRCPNRTIRYDWLHQRKSVIKCPEGRPLMDWRFMCWPCDEETPVDMSFGQELNEQFCHGKRYIKKHDYISYKCPQDKQKLKEDECRQCNGKWDGWKCR